MTKIKSVLYIFALAAIVSGAPSRNITDRIVGGQDADISSYPYTLQLEYMDELVCGAVLVSTNYAVTAAHCVVTRYMEDFVVRAGATTLYEGGQELTITAIQYHPNYAMLTNAYGVALLQLSQSVSVSNASPIGLATSDDAIVEGANILVAGWGWQEFAYYTEFSTTLQVIDLPILDYDTCSSAYEIVSDEMFCAAYLAGAGRGFCNGDNGGPGVINGVLVGVISSGQNCGDGSHAGVLIRVSKVRDWIVGITGVTAV